MIRSSTDGHSLGSTAVFGTIPTSAHSALAIIPPWGCLPRGASASWPPNGPTRSGLPTARWAAWLPIPGEPMAPSPALFGSSPLRGALARGVLVGGAAAVGWAIARRYADDGDTAPDRLGHRHRRRHPRQRRRRRHLAPGSRAPPGRVRDDGPRDRGTDRRLHRHDPARLARSTSACSTAPSGSRRTSPASSRCSARSKRSTPRRSARRRRHRFPGMTAAEPRRCSSGQVGLLLGFLARKVLGQYDISLLGHEPLQAGKLYFVEPNIRAARRAR